ncbi:CDP-alcohol phosphatidyltransferase family protein [Roseinatronobacter sp. NSM]|uniref:CDP-alcohol phosphatidyltransferase family protein n=1 Tax=Roseinatronobacter sp. NSM TaxID=3457785 RepID=UPI0040367972
MVDLSFSKPVTPFARVQLQAICAIVCAGVIASLGGYGLGQAAGMGPRAALVCAALAAAVWLVGAVGVLAGLKPAYFPHDRLGLANVVTLWRGACIAAMAGVLAVPQALAQGGGWLLAGLAALVLALDGVDGWAARRAGLSSRFGARLDVETDVAFALVTAALAVAAGKVGVWFLALGLLRPAFLGAAYVWPVLRAPLPPSQRRRMVAGLQMGAQVALLAPILTAPVSGLVGGAVLLVVGVSFAVDIRALLARRGQGL